jgi:hypothetical protein
MIRNTSRPLWEAGKTGAPFSTPLNFFRVAEFFQRPAVIFGILGRADVVVVMERGRGGAHVMKKVSNFAKLGRFFSRGA